MTSSDRQLSKFAAIFASGTMLSRILGMVRDMVIARTVGLESKDAFFFGFKLPNMLRDLVGEGAMNAAFVPVFSESAEKESNEAFRELVSAAMSAMLIVLLVLTVLGVVFVRVLISGIPALTPFTKGEVTPEQIDLMVSIAGWVFPYLFFIGMAVFAMGPLFTVKHYATPSWSPALLNISLIAACYLFRDRFGSGAYALVVGVWVGGIAQLAVQYVALGKYTGVWWPNFRLWHPGIRTIFFLMGPVILGQATGEVNKLVDIFFAASLAKGTITALFFANRLVQLPLSVFGMAVAAAVLPALSGYALQDDFGSMRSTLMHGLRQTFLFVLPSLLGLIFFGAPIIRLLFGESANFTPELSRRTSTALAIYAAGLLSFAWVKVLVTGFYAMKDTKTPVLVASASMLLNIVLNILLVRPLGYQGLALATTISFTANGAALYILLSNRIGPLWDAPFITALLRMATAAVMMVAVLHVTHLWALSQFDGDGLLDLLIRTLLPIGVAGTAYLGFCKLFGVEELGHFASLLRRK